jgi:hypothetical protein
VSKLTVLDRHDVALPPPKMTAQEQRATAAVKHGLYATATAARLRRRRLRARVRGLKKQFPALADRPDHLILRYCEVDALAAAVWCDLQERGPVNEQGEPRRLLEEYRRLLAELRSLAGTLGLLEPADDDPVSALLRRASR